MSEPITEIVVFRSKPGHAARVRELAVNVAAEQILMSYFHRSDP